MADSELISDAELVERAQEDPEAFSAIYERYMDRIYNYVYYRTGNHHDAEDLTARVFLRAMNHLPRYTHRGLPLSAWLYRIAHNLVANWHRDQSRRRVVALDESISRHSPAEAPESVATANQERAMLMQAIRRLPPERQHLIILKFVERLSNAEIGDTMGRSEGAIKSLYHRTLIALRQELDTVSQEPFLE